MRSCWWIFGWAAIAFGAGIVIGCLVPAQFVVWLMGVVLIAVGWMLLRRW